MGKNNGNNDVIELWGHDFKRVKYGLDEEQIVSFVNELINHNDTIIQRQAHLSSLTELAERTIIEADTLAERVKKEALEQAKAEANTIIARAEEQAQQIIEQKRAEIIAIANEEAEAIKANARREAESLMEQQGRRIQSEIRDMAQRLYMELLSQLESLKQQVVGLEVEFEHKLSQPTEQASPVTLEEKSPSAQAPADMQQESDIIPSASSEVSLEHAEDISAQPRQPVQTIDQTNTGELEEREPVSAYSQDKATYEKVELELLPPMGAKQIMGIMGYLDSLAEVADTELIPLTDRPLIIVSLHEPVDLIEMLRTLPEVAEIKEGTDGETFASTDGADAEGKHRRIQIALSGNSVLTEAKERLDSEISDILAL